ncbi:flagellar hook assembly protein FlgD [Nitrosomonas mobilis]|uniref:Basal-body rod modification protein FlgD n=1 Tax=Nitrosomonas mobilis TaxID=51642 RepID=A0A1G5SFH8_9PROT|nr:flagellar hook assembly protein FlgD [Nitrosomonas mobilis]SCZ85149.1 flagellar hook assembly protein [Nitrosomonas mobilis]HNO75462.1 flagellar hook assembly protein FlgD [Nitrosomonas mobilis]
MNQVANVNSSISPLLGSQGENLTAVRKNEDDPQERFLKLLVTQMQNQDPLNPMDNAEVTSQLAQISTVSGIDKLNATLEKLVANADARSSFEAAAMIGRGVLVPGTSMQVEKGAGIGGFELTEPADKVVVTVKDAAGIAVRDIDLAAQSLGVNTFVWDGLTNGGTQTADGRYSFSVKAVRGEADVTATTLAFGTVSSAAPGDDGALLDVGELGFAGMNDIKKIF